ncbi:opioid growth factor receptor-related protein [Coleofasciculus sp. H7-2]|uniref:opioid growth factor receptor-related protein n=1 Tax=Coleofasciculus sp. H7-2 TaxID=3351545 RepID=UPI00366E2EC4
MTKSSDKELVAKPSPALVAFYLSQRPDSEGRMIDDIWSWNYEKLERIHDYIQWLFPLKDKSGYNPNALVLDDEVVQAFRTDALLKTRLQKSFKIMLRFYGLKCNEGNINNIQITKSDKYQDRKRTWIEPLNHNYLRIARILKCLTTLGLENYAQAFFKCLDNIYSEDSQKIGSDTYAFWKRAIEMS